MLQKEFAFVNFYDHNPKQKDETRIMAARKYDFFSGEQGLESFTLYLHQIKLSYGHDYPEAVQDGLWMAAKELSWRVPEANQNVIKLMILIADSPAHGYYSDEDHYGKDG